MGEVKLQKRLTVLGLLSLASIPLTGPFGILGASAVFSGKLFRLSYNDEARRNYESEKKESKVERNSTQHYPSLINETPKTSIARQTPSQAIWLLEQDSKREEYNKGLREGAQIATNYLGNLSPKKQAKIKSIEIYPEHETQFLGIPTGRKSLEVNMILKKVSV